MISRLLLNDQTWVMSLAWFGMGRMTVLHRPTGRVAVAPKWLKSHFIETISALSKNGVIISPTNELLLDFFAQYAELTMDPYGLLARAALIGTPPHVMAERVLLGIK